MAKWVRSQEPSNSPIRFTIVVKNESEPELYKWLSEQPWGTTNKKIRNILIEAIREGKSDILHPKNALIAQPEPKPDSEPKTVLQSQKNNLSDSAVSQEPAQTDDEQNLSFSEEELKAMTAMQNRF